MTDLIDLVQRASPSQRAELAKLASAFAPYQANAFRSKYRDDPAGFVRDCISWQAGQGPSDYQFEILTALATRRRVSLRGPHGLGKTALVSWVLLWFALVSDGEDWKAPTTASAWRQLQKFMWPEVHKWAQLLKWEIIGREPFTRFELLDLSLKLENGEAFALASDNPALIEGAHAKRLLYIFDESKEIPPGTWDAAEGAFSTGECYWLAVSTPGEPNGRFYEIHKRAPGLEDWYARHVTMSEAIAAGRLSEAWAEQRRKQWGETSVAFQNRVMGEFAASSSDTVISLAGIERANKRWQARADLENWDPFFGVGVDVGRGGDLSVVALRHGQAIRELRRTGSDNTMELAGSVAGLLELHPKGIAAVDVIGIGAGVVDRLREKSSLYPRVKAFNAAERTSLKDRSGELGFVNMRSAGWWVLREMLEDDVIDLPPDDKLTGDLTAPTWKIISDGKIQVESKDNVRARIGRSTDDADAVIMIFVPLFLGPDDQTLVQYAKGGAGTSQIDADIEKYMRDAGIKSR